MFFLYPRTISDFFGKKCFYMENLFNCHFCSCSQYFCSRSQNLCSISQHFFSLQKSYIFLSSKKHQKKHKPIFLIHKLFLLSSFFLGGKRKEKPVCCTFIDPIESHQYSCFFTFLLYSIFCFRISILEMYILKDFPWYQ